MWISENRSRGFSLWHTNRILVGVILLISSSITSAATGSDDTDIRNLLQKTYIDSVNLSAAADYAGLFTSDGARIPPGRVVENSPTEIKSVVTKLFGKVKFDVALTVDEVETAGSLAWASASVQGTTTALASGDVTKRHFRVIFILKQHANQWKIYRQIWNSAPT